MSAPIPSKLDSSQILPASFDENLGALRTTITTTIPGDLEVRIDADDDNIRLGGSGGSSDLITSTTISGKHGLDVNVIDGISGDFTPSGLRVAMRVTTMNVSDSATQLPAVALSGRNAISIRNKSNTDIIYISQSNSVSADSVVGTSSGWECGPSEDVSIDITDSIVLYAIAETGKTVLVKVLELA